MKGRTTRRSAGGLFEDHHQRDQADAQPGNDADALAQAAAIGHDVLRDAALRRTWIAAVEWSGGSRGMVTFGVVDAHDASSRPSPRETGKNSGK